MAVPVLRTVVASNAAAVAEQFRGLAADQLPFATAVTLTRLAQVAAADTKERLRKYFTLRNQRVQQGIRIKRAEKADWPHPTAEVGSVDSFMVHHVTGEPKVSTRSVHVAIPARVALKTRTARGMIPKRLKPRPLIESGKGFKDEAGETIYRRTERLKGRIANFGIARFYRLVRSQPMKRRWPFDEDVESIVAANYERVFSIELAAALRSRRVRDGSFSEEGGRAAYNQALQRVVAQGAF